MPELEKSDYDIMHEIYRAVALLGGKSDILALIGSWRDCLGNEDVLAGLREWNKFTAEELNGRLEV